MTTFGHRHTDDTLTLTLTPTPTPTPAPISNWERREIPAYVWVPGFAVVAVVVFVMIHLHLSATAPVVADKPPGPVATEKVPLKRNGGTYMVPVEINDAIMLDFAVDSGAADVSVPADVFSTLTRTGAIKSTDIIGKQTYVLADGSRFQSVTFTIRSLKVGDLSTIFMVRGSVAPAQGSLLLGQSFLERFKSWSIDNMKHELLLEPR